MRTLFVAVALAAAVSVSAAATPRRMPNLSCTVWVSAPEAPQTYTDRAPTFVAAAVEDLRLELAFTKALFESLGSGDHVAELLVFTPRGSLYQTMAVPFTTNMARLGQKVKVDGYPREMLIQVTGEAAGPVTATLPVAGTSIVQSSIYGDWRVEARLDGSTAACGGPSTFSIQP